MHSVALAHRVCGKMHSVANLVALPKHVGVLAKDCDMAAATLCGCDAQAVGVTQAQCSQVINLCMDPVHGDVGHVAALHRLWGRTMGLM